MKIIFLVLLISLNAFPAQSTESEVNPHMEEKVRYAELQNEVNVIFDQFLLDYGKKVFSCYHKVIPNNSLQIIINDWLNHRRKYNPNLHADFNSSIEGIEINIKREVHYLNNDDVFENEFDSFLPKKFDHEEFLMTEEFDAMIENRLKLWDSLAEKLGSAIKKYK